MRRKDKEKTDFDARKKLFEWNFNKTKKGKKYYTEIGNVVSQIYCYLQRNHIYIHVLIWRALWLETYDIYVEYYLLSSLLLYYIIYYYYFYYYYYILIFSFLALSLLY